MGVVVLQVIGTKKCPETRKAIRFCKEHSIEFHFVDLVARNLSDGEWNNIFQVVEPKSLIDENSAYYKKEGYAWRAYDPEEELDSVLNSSKRPYCVISKRLQSVTMSSFCKHFRSLHDPLFSIG